MSIICSLSSLARSASYTLNRQYYYSLLGLPIFSLYSPQLNETTLFTDTPGPLLDVAGTLLNTVLGSQNKPEIHMMTFEYEQSIDDKVNMVSTSC